MDYTLIAILGGALFAIAFLLSIIFRRVVPTNEVHIIQSRKDTTSYGKDTGNGNIYYEWPSWVPFFGVTKISLPTAVFQLELNSYDAYDKDRVPFEVDVVAFFRISDSNTASQRVASFHDLQTQLMFIVRGAVRTILAAHDIDDIMTQRSTFGAAFTAQVEAQLPQWGVVAVQNIELMDIRDSADNKVVHNIMQKKKSFIEMQSRSEVANNMQKATVAEIEAKRETEVQAQNAKQAVGLQTIEADRAMEVSKQKAIQQVKEEARATVEREMGVQKMRDVSTAEIEKQVKIVNAEQDRETAIIIAEGKLESVKREATGIAAQGQAKAEAEKAMQLAPVQAQIELAKEIGQNQGYQTYLVSLRQVEATQIVGVAQAAALTHAEIKIIANAGDASSGITKATDMISAKGGTNIGSMIEGFANTPQGKAIIGSVLGKIDRTDKKA